MQLQQAAQINRYPFIDLLRGIAALWVCVAHCLIWTGVGLPEIASPKLAVDLFMIISGFLMMAQIRARQSAEPMKYPRNWIRFYLRRYFRIAPAYYLSLLLAILCADWFLGGYSQLRDQVGGWLSQAQHLDPKNIKYDAQNIFTHITFIFGLYPKGSFSTFLPDWSLSLEMQFYFAFPLIFLMCERLGWIRSLFLLGLFFGTLNTLWYKGLRNEIIDQSLIFLEPSLLIFKIQYFLIGIAVYEIIHSHQKYSIALTTFLLIFLCGIEIGQSRSRTLMRLLMVLAVIVLAKNSRPVFQEFLSTRIVRRMSDSAYSVYLFHGFFIAAAGYFMAPQLVAKPILMVVWVVPAAYAWAQLVEHWVERPGIQLTRHALARLPSQTMQPAR